MSQADRPQPPITPKGRRDPPTGPRRRLQKLWLAVPAMRYQNAYVWLILFATMDVMLTWKILSKGGTELNPIARAVFDYWNERWGDPWDLWGAIGFKFCLILFVIVACEVVGRRKDGVGRWLARFAVFLSALPVFYSLGLLWYHTFFATAAGASA